LKRDPHQLSPDQKEKKQRRENEYYRALSSPSMTGYGLSKKQKAQFEEALPETRVPIVKSLEKSAKELGAREIKQKKERRPHQLLGCASFLA
jgi:hypothetical protein